MTLLRTAVLLPLISLAATAIHSQPAEQQPKAPVLVSTTWLTDHLRDDKLVILHVGNEGTFTAGHIPGARLMPPASYTPSRNGLSTELPDSAVFRDMLRTAGISNDSRIIIVSAAHPPTLAARLYVTLDHFGLGAQTSLLDGGMRVWRAENRTVSTDAASTLTGAVTLLQRTDIFVDHNFLNMRLAEPSAAIVDARDTRFFTGEAQNMGSAARPGRIPSARNIVYSTLVAESGLMLSRDSIAAMFNAAGVPAGKQVVTYCHVGQQASLAFLAARIAGYDVRIYDGSYEDWSKRTELRVETGPPR